MKTKLFAHLGAIGMLSVGLVGGTTAIPDSSNSFSAVLTGDVKATISGGAIFGSVAGGPTAPDVFTVSLGADSSQGAVLFTQPNSRSLKVGSYRISDADHTEGSVQALVMFGSSNRPEGVYRGSTGTLDHFDLPLRHYRCFLPRCCRLSGFEPGPRGPASIHLGIVHGPAQLLSSYLNRRTYECMEG